MGVTGAAGNGGDAARGRQQAAGGCGSSERGRIILFATLTQNLVDSRLSGGHIVDGAGHGDSSVEAERVHVIDARDGYPRVSLLFDVVDDAPVFPDDPADEIVVSEHFQAQIRFIQLFALVLHHFQDFTAGDGRTGRISSVDGDDFFRSRVFPGG